MFCFTTGGRKTKKNWTTLCTYSIIVAILGQLRASLSFCCKYQQKKRCFLHSWSKVSLTYKPWPTNCCVDNCGNESRVRIYTQWSNTDCKTSTRFFGLLAALLAFMAVQWCETRNVYYVTYRSGNRQWWLYCTIKAHEGWVKKKWKFEVNECFDCFKGGYRHIVH